MIRLKAAIIDQEEKMAFRQTNKTPRLRAQRGAKVGDRKDVFSEHNKGVSERSKLDEVQNSKLSKQDLITTSLIAKVKS
jgi:hypothetical protein